MLRRVLGAVRRFTEGEGISAENGQGVRGRKAISSRGIAWVRPQSQSGPG